MVKEGRNDHWYLEKARQMLEYKLAWGEVEEWTSEDFQNLSDAILAATDLSLSVTTLKRLVGRVNYNATPNPTTLNALARFLGYDNWRVFKQRLAAPLKKEAEKVQKKESLKTSLSKFIWWILPLLLIFSLVFIFLAVKNDAPNQTLLPAHIKDQVTFSSKALSDGLPNTVLFNYDLQNIPGKVFEIQQSWDTRKRFPIDPKRQEITSTYYYPGFYKAKLLVDDHIIREHDLFLTTIGWMAAIEENPLPRYILPEEWQKSPFLSVHTSVIEQLQQADKIPFLAYYLVQDFGTLHSADFIAETKIRHTFRSGRAACQFSRFIINCTDGFMSVPMSIAGCVGEINAYFGDLSFQGKQTDLSGLAYQESDWQLIRLEVKQQHIRLLVNGQLVLEGAFTKDPGRIVGFRYKFQGAGEVDYLRVWDGSGEQVLAETAR